MCVLAAVLACGCAFVGACVHACDCSHTCVFACVCLQACMCICMHACVCSHTCVSACVCLQACTCACRHVCIQSHTMLVCMCLQPRMLAAVCACMCTCTWSHTMLLDMSAAIPACVYVCTRLHLHASVRACLHVCVLALLHASGWLLVPPKSLGSPTELPLGVKGSNEARAGGWGRSGVAHCWSPRWKPSHWAVGAAEVLCLVQDAVVQGEAFPGMELSAGSRMRARSSSQISSR